MTACALIIAHRRFLATVRIPSTWNTVSTRLRTRLSRTVFSSSSVFLFSFLHETILIVTLDSAAGSDTLLQTPPGSPVSLIQYRHLGGTLDLYFFSGPSPNSVIEQYGALIGLPTWQPLWGFGFHLCRWGYTTVNVTRDQVVAMREAGIPLETMWNDIDLYHAFRDFTTDPVSFPIDEVKAFIEELVRCLIEGILGEVLNVEHRFRRARTTSTTSQSSTLASRIRPTIRIS